ncbi:hypothetical protein [Hymenobacter antarcticus]|uniref:Uncharacterized protein n=1 Tax=Hymenobacter antarcticus TaxID=486270 RepID=A0ABP7QR23_9BACT
MPKLIDYPRTNYTGAWELAEITDDTGGKSTIETAARKLNRKVSGSFKAIIGSAVKFGLITSKREMLTTTTLFKRIKHAYDKQEELMFHREAFLTPPLFTQLCRKFRSRELPVQMLDVMLMREFGVEEINAQGVAKAFVDGARMVGLLDEHNTIADIDALTTNQLPRRQLATPTPPITNYLPEAGKAELTSFEKASGKNRTEEPSETLYPANAQMTLEKLGQGNNRLENMDQNTSQDAIASLFGILGNESTKPPVRPQAAAEAAIPIARSPLIKPRESSLRDAAHNTPGPANTSYEIRINGPGVNTILSITEEEDIILTIALLEKIRRQIKANRADNT